MDDKIKCFMDDIEKLENWHYTEYNYSKKGGSFSSAKSNYRWIRQYLQNIRSKCSKHEDDINSFFSIASMNSLEVITPLRVKQSLIRIFSNLLALHRLLIMRENLDLEILQSLANASLRQGCWTM